MWRAGAAQATCSEVGVAAASLGAEGHLELYVERMQRWSEQRKDLHGAAYAENMGRNTARDGSVLGVRDLKKTITVYTTSHAGQ